MLTHHSHVSVVHRHVLHHVYMSIVMFMSFYYVRAKFCMGKTTRGFLDFMYSTKLLSADYSVWCETGVEMAIVISKLYKVTK